MDLLAACAALGVAASNCIIIDPAEEGPVRAVIEAAEDYGVPAELAVAFAYQESRFDCSATSRVGARGVMQVMPATAQWMRRDPSRLHECWYGAQVGMEYLSAQLVACSNDWACAAENYNCGPNCKNRNNTETARYRCRIGYLLGVKCKGKF